MCCFFCSRRSVLRSTAVGEEEETLDGEFPGSEWDGCEKKEGKMQDRAGKDRGREDRKTNRYDRMKCMATCQSEKRMTHCNSYSL